MSEHYEAMSPIGIENWLRTCVTELTNAERDLRTARDEETNADIAYRSAHRRAMFNPDCPKVTRGGYTTAERDAWVDEQCAFQWQQYRLAMTKRESAQDSLRTKRDIATAVQSIGALVRTAYNLAGAA